MNFWVYGTIAEREIGTWRFVVGYFVSGAVGAFCYRLVVPHPTGPLAGASLAIAGFVGAYAAWRWSARPQAASHRRVALVLEVFLVAGVAIWLAIRVAPLTPNLPSSVMYHFLPFLAMWLGVRGYGALRTHGT